MLCLHVHQQNLTCYAWKIKDTTSRTLFKFYKHKPNSNCNTFNYTVMTLTHGKLQQWERVTNVIRLNTHPI